VRPQLAVAIGGAVLDLPRQTGSSHASCRMAKSRARVSDHAARANAFEAISEADQCFDNLPKLAPRALIEPVTAPLLGLMLSMTSRPPDSTNAPSI